MTPKILRIIARLEHYADRRWYPPVVAALALIDLFVGIIPTEGVLITSVVLVRKRWLSLWLWTSLGSAVGSLVLAYAVRYLGIHNLVHAEEYPKILAWIEDHGSIGLALISLSPLPQQPAVFFCGLSDMSLSAVFFSVLIGRLVKYGFFIWAALKSPNLLEQFGLAAKERKQIEEADADLHRHPPSTD